MLSSELALRSSILSSAVSLVTLAVKVSSFPLVVVPLLKIASGCLLCLCPCSGVLCLQSLMIVVRYLHIPASIGR